MVDLRAEVVEVGGVGDFGPLLPHVGETARSTIFQCRGSFESFHRLQLLTLYVFQLRLLGVLWR